ncbi:MAG TPA: hypothetical protein VE983_04635, partial [Solirubrobacteraceae bacterium]|nr:hypothetical protein [Solirubrobacteraceae bacterium]
MEHKTPGVGGPVGIDSSPGTKSPEQPNVPSRRKRGRAEPRPVELTVAGVAWRSSGSGRALVVLARGYGAGQMRSSFATLNVFHGGQTFPVTTPVSVIAGEEDTSSSRQTLRFVFRLPNSAATWSIDRMVLRWRGTEVELPPPARPPDGGSEPEAELELPRPPAGLGDDEELAGELERAAAGETGAP